MMCEAIAQISQLAMEQRLIDRPIEQGAAGVIDLTDAVPKPTSKVDQHLAPLEIMAIDHLANGRKQRIKRVKPGKHLCGSLVLACSHL